MKKTLFFDSETDGLDWGCKAYMLAFARGEEEEPRVIDWRKIKLDFSKYTHVVGANTFFDLRLLGLDNIPEKCDDVLVAHYIMTGKWQGLKDISISYGIGDKSEQDEVIEAMRQLPRFKKASFERCITNAFMVWPITAKYCARDVDLTRKLYYLFLKEGVFSDPNYLRVVNAERDAFLQTMQGVKIDIERAKAHTVNIGSREQAIKKEVKFNHDILISSPTQLGRVLGVDSTKKSALELLADANPLAADALEFREIQSAIKTLTKQLTHPVVHPRISWHCVTGRASTSAPNLQGLPAKTLCGQDLRTLVTSDGEAETVLSCDFSQIEYRIFIAQSQEPSLIDALKHGKDLHDEMQNILFAGLSRDEKIKMLKDSCKKSNVKFPKDFELSSNFAADEHRLQAGAIRKAVKRTVFATMYGSSIGGLIAQGHAPQVAREVYNYFARIKRQEWYVLLLRDWYKTKCTHTMFGRRIFVDSEHKLLNYRTQGTAADTMQEFSCNLAKFLRGHNHVSKVSQLEESAKLGRIIFTIHDECVLSVKEGKAEKVKKEIHRLADRIKFDFGNGEAVNLGVEVKEFPNRCWGIK